MSFRSPVICRPIIRSLSGWSCWTMRKTSKPELNYGGLVAGPIFARIAEKGRARYLDLAPQPDLMKPTAAGRVAFNQCASGIEQSF